MIRIPKKQDLVTLNKLSWIMYAEGISLMILSVVVDLSVLLILSFSIFIIGVGFDCYTRIILELRRILNG